jgi:hypothetical protein
MPEGAVGVAAFRGAVRCRRDPAGPLEITLEGRAADATSAAGEPLAVAFSGATDPGLPEALEDAVVERVAPARYRIAAGGRDWLLEAAAVHLHLDLARALYQALPPQRAPTGRRLTFRLALWLARSRAGLALLRALSG